MKTLNVFLSPGNVSHLFASDIAFAYSIETALQHLLIPPFTTINHTFTVSTKEFNPGKREKEKTLLHSRPQKPRL